MSKMTTTPTGKPVHPYLKIPGVILEGMMMMK
jgi:hypothetical protein